MAVIREGMEAATVVDYDTPEFVAIDEDTAPAHTLRSVALSASMCTTPSTSSASALFDPAYYEDLVARPFREGTIGESPVLPGAGLFMPPGTSAGKDKGLFRLTVPEFHYDVCTGCMECALVCPDAAIPNTVHEIHDLLLAAIKEIDVSEPQREALRAHVYALAERVREAYRQDKAARPFHEVVAEAATTLDRRPAHAGPQPGHPRRHARRTTRSPAPARSSTRWRTTCRARARSSRPPSTRGSAPAAWSASRSADPAPSRRSTRTPTSSRRCRTASSS